MRIPVLIEPVFDQDSVWCRQMRTGMEAEAARKKYELVFLDGEHYREIDYITACAGLPMVALAGTTPSWMVETLRSLTERNIQVILASYQPPEHVKARGIVRIDYGAGVDRLLQYFRACGKPHTALYGCSANSSNDEVKRASFLYFLSQEGVPAPERSIFYNHGSLSQCYERFAPLCGNYDSVLCVNDIVAASLITHLGREGIRVPDTLFVAAFGNTEIARLFHPGITTVMLDHERVGRQLISLFVYLARSESDVFASVRVPCRLSVRESTANIPFLGDDMLTRTPPPAAQGDFYQDDEVRVFMCLERLLNQCDELDYGILRGLMAGETYEALAERLDTPVNTLRYRVRRLAQCVGVKTREELMSFVTTNGFAERALK